LQIDRSLLKYRHVARNASAAADFGIRCDTGCLQQ
jgi:hypothetical protein